MSDTLIRFVIYAVSWAIANIVASAWHIPNWKAFCIALAPVVGVYVAHAVAPW